MKNVLYMKVTKDEYELPVAVADSISLLARMLGISKKTIESSMSKSRHLGYRSVYVKVELEEDDDE